MYTVGALRKCMLEHAFYPLLILQLQADESLLREQAEILRSYVIKGRICPYRALMIEIYIWKWTKVVAYKND